MKSCDQNLNVVLLGELVFLMLDLEVCVCLVQGAVGDFNM